MIARWVGLIPAAPSRRNCSNLVANSRTAASGKTGPGKMRLSRWLSASALALAAAVGPDSALQTAQSFTIPTACTDAAQCAAFCRSVGEAGRTESDFIALAAYQLGPDKPID